MSDGKRISRRAALIRLGLGAASAYMAPSMVGLSQARASSASPASAPSPATPPSPASPASSPSPASAPSGASDPSGPSIPDGDGLSSPSGPGTCRSSSFGGNAQISRKDYQRAQRAIARGEARPLQEVLQKVQSKQPGKLLQVGFSDKGKRTNFRVLIVDQSGAVVSVSVDAGSGQITSIRKC